MNAFQERNLFMNPAFPVIHIQINVAILRDQIILVVGYNKAETHRL